VGSDRKNLKGKGAGAKHPRKFARAASGGPPGGADKSERKGARRGEKELISRSDIIEEEYRWDLGATKSAGERSE